MSDASRLARLAFSQKPAGTPYEKFQLPQSTLDSIDSCRSNAAEDASYAAAVSYVEAIAGLRIGSTSWGVIRLYYSSYYSIKAILLLSGVVPFNEGGEMLLDLATGSFLKGGKSSHHWNWASIRRATAMSSWFISQDSEEAYKILREHRENVNYTHGFNDPQLHLSLVSPEPDMAKRFRYYRDDIAFTYTYLANHLSVAYPTKLLFEVEMKIRLANIQLPPERLSHLSSIWKLKDRCPLT